MLYTKRSLTNRHYVRSTCAQDLETLQDTINSLLHSNISLRDQNADLKDQISVLEINLETLEANLNANDGIINNLNLTIKDLRAQVTSLMNENNKLKNDLNTANANITSLNGQINSLNAEVTLLRNKNTSLLKDLTYAIYTTGNAVTHWDQETGEFFLELGTLDPYYNTPNGDMLTSDSKMGFFANDGSSVILQTYYGNNTLMRFSIKSTYVLECSFAGLSSTNSNSYCVVNIKDGKVYLKFKNINNSIKQLKGGSVAGKTEDVNANSIRNIISFLQKFCV